MEKSPVDGSFFCTKVYIGMTPKITPKLLIWNMILELTMAYDEVNNGHDDDSINRIGKT